MDCSFCSGWVASMPMSVRAFESKNEFWIWPITFPKKLKLFHFFLWYFATSAMTTSMGFMQCGWQWAREMSIKKCPVLWLIQGCFRWFKTCEQTYFLEIWVHWFDCYTLSLITHRTLDNPCMQTWPRAKSCSRPWRLLQAKTLRFCNEEKFRHQADFLHLSLMCMHINVTCKISLM